MSVDVAAGLERAHRRNAASTDDASEARLDRQSLDFHQRVNAGYRKIAALEPERFRLVDGEGDPAQIAERVWSEVKPLLAKIK